MWVVCSGYNISLLQGVKAEQMEAATKSLEARLQASEQTTELIKTFSSPQVSAALILHSPPPQPHLHTPHSVTSHPHTQHPHSDTHLTPCLTHIPPPPPPCPHTPLTLLPTPHSITSHPRTPLLYILHHISTIHSPRSPLTNTLPHSHLSTQPSPTLTSPPNPPEPPLSLLHPTLPTSPHLSTQLSRSPYR